MDYDLVVISGDIAEEAKERKKKEVCWFEFIAVVENNNIEISSSNVFMVSSINAEREIRGSQALQGHIERWSLV